MVITVLVLSYASLDNSVIMYPVNSLIPLNFATHFILVSVAENNFEVYVGARNSRRTHTNSREVHEQINQFRGREFTKRWLESLASGWSTRFLEVFLERGSECLANITGSSTGRSRVNKLRRRVRCLGLSIPWGSIHHHFHKKLMAFSPSQSHIHCHKSPTRRKTSRKLSNRVHRNLFKNPCSDFSGHYFGIVLCRATSPPRSFD